MEITLYNKPTAWMDGYHNKHRKRKQGLDIAPSLLSIVKFKEVTNCDGP